MVSCDTGAGAGFTGFLLALQPSSRSGMVANTAADCWLHEARGTLCRNTAINLSSSKHAPR